MAQRVTQQATEVLVQPVPGLHVTQAGLEVLVGAGELHEGSFEMGALGAVDLQAGKALEAQMLMPLVSGTDPVVSGADPVVARWPSIELGALGGMEFTGTQDVVVETTIAVGSLGAIEFVGQAIRQAAMEVGGAGAVELVGQAIRHATIEVGAAGGVEGSGEAQRHGTVSVGAAGELVFAVEKIAWAAIEVGSVGGMVVLVELIQLRGDVAMTEGQTVTGYARSRHANPLRPGESDPQTTGQRRRNTVEVRDTEEQ